MTQLATSKAKKETMVAGYVEKLAASQAIIVSDYRGLTVGAITELRQKLREVGANFQVVKNTLFEHVMEQAGLPFPEEQFHGPTALSFCLRDVPPVVKVLMDYASENDALVLKGTIWGTTVLGLEDTKALANLPPREVVLGQLLGAVQGPMVNMVSVLTAPMRELAQVLAARGDHGEAAA